MLALLLAFLLFADVVSAAFSDAMARKQMIFMSAAAYSDEPQTCFENIAMDVTVWTSLLLDIGERSSCSERCAGHCELQ